MKHPEPLLSPWIAIGVLCFSIVAESVSLWGCTREVNKIRRNRSYFRWFRESRESELLVVFGEDLAALLGLMFALVAVTLSMLTGNPMYDALGSVMIGVLLIVIAVMIGVEVKRLLIGQSVDPETQKEMITFLQSQDEIKQVYNLITFQLGQDVMVAVKAEMEECASQREMIKAINRCERLLKETFPQVVWSFFEPDITDQP